MDDVVTAFLQAADTVGELLDDPETRRRWEDPSGLEGLSIGGLAAHLAQGVVLIRALLDQPEVADTPVVDLGEYIASFKMEDFDADIHRYLRDKAVHSATYGPERTAARFREVVAGLGERLPAESAGRILDMRPTLAWGVSLETRLRLQVVEFVVHADDLAAALGRPGVGIPEAATNIAVDALMAAARFLSGDCAVIRAMARQERSAEEVFPVL